MCKREKERIDGERHGEDGTEELGREWITEERWKKKRKEMEM